MNNNADWICNANPVKAPPQDCGWNNSTTNTPTKLLKDPFVLELPDTLTNHRRPFTQFHPIRSWRISAVAATFMSRAFW